MTSEMHIGSTLLRKNLTLPRGLLVSLQRHSAEWSRITEAEALTFDRVLRARGWSFFFAAAVSHASALGSTEESRAERAVNALLRRSETHSYNGFSVTGITTHRFMGVPYTTVSGHYRQVQSTPVLADASRR